MTARSALKSDAAARPKTNFGEIFGVARFSTFVTISSESDQIAVSPRDVAMGQGWKNSQ
jgi:hypothetical protein